jgi:heme/copper-type cytochrome/quinol oxidase subunit 2
MSFEEFIKQADKYYTTLGVIILIFLVVIFYMIWLDRKMTRLENKNKE